ncbi:hypothetical protein [Parasedimentitalea huanghaiensis]|uniref:Uncharacterized protein n=1 Tax=Parasedimentitalea huanghaiensis TaxID=2682100 RepID=A0A6L6WCB1_9RHOB|nr:hypothetical protein [Zongyanglinia huanghaiensis]MVO15200.1 hypothetical protein [Zongyanglinia huanghaiensis]
MDTCRIRHFLVFHLREVESATSAAKTEANRLSKGAVQPLERAVTCIVGPSRLPPIVLKFLTDHPDGMTGRRF